MDRNDSALPSSTDSSISLPDFPLGDGTPASEIAQLIELLRTQKDLYAKLLAAGREQREAEAPDTMLAALSRRSALVRELTGLNDRLAPCRVRWPLLREHALTAAREEVAGLVGQIAALRDAIVSQDEAEVRKARNDKQSLAGMLAQLAQAQRRRAKSVYAAAAAIR